jgi:RNA polymerase sigma-70 factor, ECF subfamily
MREDHPVPQHTTEQCDLSVSRDDALTRSGGRPPQALPGAATTGQTDHVLVGQCRGGDQNAATQLYARYAKRLMALVRRRCSADLARAAGVEDIVQSVFKTLFQRIGQGYYDIPDGEELWKLLLVITLNKIRAKATYIHAVKRDPRRSADAASTYQSLEWLECSRTAAVEHADLVLEETLERLPIQHRLMLQLRIDGYTVAEIAGLTGRSLRSVERILQETRSKLRDLLPEES